VWDSDFTVHSFREKEKRERNREITKWIQLKRRSTINLSLDKGEGEKKVFISTQSLIPGLIYNIRKEWGHVQSQIPLRVDYMHTLCFKFFFVIK